eukprot:382433_1
MCLCCWSWLPLDDIRCRFKLGKFELCNYTHYAYYSSARSNCSGIMFANSLWKRETITRQNILIWICLNMPCISISLMCQYCLSFEWSITILILVYFEKILSILYLTIYSFICIRFLLQLSFNPLTIKTLIFIITINLLYFSYRCVLFLYFSIFTEFVTFWIAFQTINYLTTKTTILHFSNYWTEKSTIVRPFINHSQFGCYQLKQTISVLYGYLDNITETYIPKDREITDKTKKLIQILCFHLSMILLLLRIKCYVLNSNNINVVFREILQDKAAPKERCKNEIDCTINKLMECINIELIDYSNKDHINCPHFIENNQCDEQFDIDFKFLMLSSEKFTMTLNIILTMFYVIMNYIFWNRLWWVFNFFSVLILLFAMLVFCQFYMNEMVFNKSYHCEPENWDKLLNFYEMGPWYPWFGRRNKMRVSYDLFWKIYGLLQYIPDGQKFNNKFMKPKYLGWSNPTKRYMSKYHQMILENFEVFLPIYFSWHIISAAFNDNFTISRVVINYLYGM